MKERPILFNNQMVRAILRGQKTQTRRVMKPQPDLTPEWDSENQVVEFYAGDEFSGSITCPYGQPGDRLWVRETFSGPYGCRNLRPRDWPVTCPVWYWADGNPNDGDWTKPYPSIHMPRWACRLVLEIVSVRVERLLDISEADAAEEGCGLSCMSPAGDDNGSFIYGPSGFAALWESINGPESWGANPWVWVVEFSVVQH